MNNELRIERARTERAEQGRNTAVARADVLEARARQAEKQSRDLRVHLDDLADRLAKAGGELDPLRNELHEAKSELATLREQAAAATQAAETATARLTAFTERAESAERERDQLRVDHQALTEKSSFYEQAAKDASSSLAAASAAQVEAEAKATELQVALDQRHEEHRQERNRLSRENERLEKQVAQLETALEESKRGIGDTLRRRFGR